MSSEDNNNGIIIMGLFVTIMFICLCAAAMDIGEKQKIIDSKQESIDDLLIKFDELKSKYNEVRLRNDHLELSCQWARIFEAATSTDKNKWAILRAELDAMDAMMLRSISKVSLKKQSQKEKK